MIMHIFYLGVFSICLHCFSASAVPAAHIADRVGMFGGVGLTERRFGGNSDQQEELRKQNKHRDHCVKIDADGTPKYYWTNKYVPICGHWFWDNNNGAKSICQKLGYSNGALSRTNQAYTEDAIMLGRCKSGENYQHCSEDCWSHMFSTPSGVEKFVGKVFQGCADCTAGQRVGIKISCTGLTAGTEVFEKTCRD